MRIYPAIDLSDGKCVRLYKGDFNTSKIYNENPFAILDEFANAGAQWVHIVDLDGAKVGKTTQHTLIAQLVKHNPKLQLEVGGGIRSSDDVDALLNAGAARVVVGSLCVSSPALIQEWLHKFGSDRIVLALDCELDKNGIPKVKTHGWQTESILSVYDILNLYPSAKYILCTDVGVDGTLAGPSLALYKQIQLRFPQLELIASGGVGKLEDLIALKKMDIHGVVVGKALYENKFTLTQALAV